MKLLTREDIPEDAITVSPSQIALFQRCAYKWYLSKKEGKQEFRVTTEKMTLGTIFHKLLQNYYNLYLDRPVELLSSQELVNLMERTQAENGWTDYDSQLLFINAYTIFITYMKWAARSEQLIPVGTEVETFAPTGLRSNSFTGSRPIYLHGILDLVAERNGALGTVDHKTHTRRPWTVESIVFDIQTNFYPMLVALQGIEIEWAMISTIDMWLPKNNVHEALQREERFQRYILKRSMMSLEAYKDEIFKVIKQMWCDPTFQYTRRLDKFCSGCGFSELCMTYLQGLDFTELMDSKFESTTMEVQEFDAQVFLGDVDSPDASSYPVLDDN